MNIDVKKLEEPYYSCDKPLFDSPVEKRGFEYCPRYLKTVSRMKAVPELNSKDAKEFQIKIGDYHVNMDMELITSKNSRTMKSKKEQHRFRFTLKAFLV